ncbi:MAG: flagellar basal body rod protein FlgB [Planctomycetes bacterium]|nr:flagellar basal body rod protein FlgB [Planctomycetota bacterium]
MFRKGALPVLEQAMNFHEQRHKYIVQNIANIETPGYERRDLDPAAFRNLVKESIVVRDKKAVKTFDMNGDGHHWMNHLGNLRVGHVKDRGRDILRHDENNTSIETEMVELTKNGMAFQGRANLYKKQLELMRSAIRGN